MVRLLRFLATELPFARYGDASYLMGRINPQKNIQGDTDAVLNY